MSRRLYETPAGFSAGIVSAQAPWNRRQRPQITGLINREPSDIAHMHNSWIVYSPAEVDAIAEASVPVAMTVHNCRPTCSNTLLCRGDAICEDCVGASPSFVPDPTPRVWRQALARLRGGSALDEAGGIARVISAERFAQHRNLKGLLAAYARVSSLAALAETRYA